MDFSEAYPRRAMSDKLKFVGHRAQMTNLGPILQFSTARSISKKLTPRKPLK